jgi:hypothetical protein
MSYGKSPWALGQVFSEHFSFPYQVSFHQLLQSLMLYSPDTALLKNNFKICVRYLLDKRLGGPQSWMGTAKNYSSVLFMHIHFTTRIIYLDLKKRTSLK